MTKLNYDLQVGESLQPVILTRDHDGLRVELHLRRDSSGEATLLAFSGKEGGVQKRKLQGPYEILAQAQAARKAIVLALKREGFQVRDASYALWSMEAQRQINAMRRSREGIEASYKFDPKDVFLDW